MDLQDLLKRVNLENQQTNRRLRRRFDVSRFSVTAKRVLLILWHKWRWYDGGNCWHSMHDLSLEIRRDEKETSRGVHELRDAGVLRRSYMVDYDGVLRGSGYFLNQDWDI